MSEVWSEQFRDISAAGSLAAFRAQHISQIMEIGIYTLTTLGGLSLVYLGVERVWAGVMSGGALFASVIFFWRVTAPWQALASNISKLEQLYRSIQQIDRLMLLDTERESAPGLGKLARPLGAVEFSKVGLRYSKESDPVCVGLSFSAQPGEMVAIAGANGCGKTTLFKLILGLYRPQAGAIYLDGRDVRQLDPVDLRKRISYVPQIPELFEGTIAENLRFGNPFASDQELWNALEYADAREQVERLSSGLDTALAGSSELLRSSLIYRLILARAYVRDAPLMLIDEMPYAVLNSNAGLLLMERIKAWRGAKTVFMVSHRDDHIRMSDRAIGLLSGGRYMVGAPDKVIRDLRDETFRLRKDIA
jgi:ABC-type bacteriocin/lantibiotic exporter with double-glycine peptidase domain